MSLFFYLFLNFGLFIYFIFNEVYQENINIYSNGNGPRASKWGGARS